MKKAAMLFLIVTAATTAAADIALTAGADAGYQLQFFTEQQPVVTTAIITQLIEANAFVDATYVRLDVGYAFTPGKPLSVKINDVESASSRPDDWWKLRVIQVEVLGKLPIPVGPVTVWPGVGVRFATIVYLDHDGDGDSEVPGYDAVNDWYLLAGLGADIPLGAGVVLTAGALFDWNLTPSPDRDFTSSYTWFDVAIRVGVGFRL